MADGSIIFKTELDNKHLEKELAKVQKDIKKTEETISEQEAKRSPLVAQAEELQRKMSEARAEVKRYRQEWLSGVVGADGQQTAAQGRLSGLEAEHQKVAEQIDKIDAKLGDARQKLNDMKEKAGGLQQKINKASSATSRMKEATQAAEKQMEKFTQRVKSLAKRVFIFTVITQALRSLKDWLWSAVKTNDDAVAAVARLKAALYTLAQPIVEVVIPAFTYLVDMLTAVVVAIGNVFAALSGQTYEETQKSAEALYNEQQALEGVGDAAKKATKQLASFDEINKLSDSSSTATSSIVPDFSGLSSFVVPEWISNLTMTMEDVLFEWENLTAEDILKKIVTGLDTIGSTLIGFFTGGLGGAAIGATVGSSIGAGIASFMFDEDGQVSVTEMLDTLVWALGGIGGAIVGFKLGGLKGAAIGATVGSSITTMLNYLTFDHDGEMSKEEVLKLACDAIGGLIGAVIGFTVGGLAGAAIGGTIGASIMAALTTLAFRDDSSQAEKKKAQSRLKTVLSTLLGTIIDTVFGGKGVFAGFIGDAIKLALGCVIDLSIDEVNDDEVRKKFANNELGIGGGMFGGEVSLKAPGLATGSVIPPNREFLAVLGDNKTETEVVSPLSTMKQAMIEAMRESGGGGGNVNITFEGELSALARVLRPYIKDEDRRVGGSLVTR